MWPAIAFTFVIVHIAWVPFRSESIDKTFQIFQLAPESCAALFAPGKLITDLGNIGWGGFEVAAALFGVGMIAVVHEIQSRHDSARGLAIRAALGSPVDRLLWTCLVVSLSGCVRGA